MTTYEKTLPTVTTEVDAANRSVRLIDVDGVLKAHVKLPTSAGGETIEVDVATSNLTSQQKTDLDTILGALRDDALSQESYAAQ